MTTSLIPSASVTLEDLYSISRIASGTEDFRTTLDEIAREIRTHLIFDNLVVFSTGVSGTTMEVVYARAMGRGRSAGAEVSWGEQAAARVLQTRQPYLQEPPGLTDSDRLDKPYLLALPLIVNQRVFGAMVFIRFGSPGFTSGNINLADFVASQTAIVLERQNLKHAFQHLEEQNRKSQLEEDFISTITHELRSPLGFIKGYITTLLRKDTLWNQETQQEFFKIIDQETDHLQELIEDLLDSARLHSGQLPMQFQPVRLDGILNDVIARSRLHQPSPQIMMVENSLNEPVEGDPNRLSQVFDNLINNAGKYAPGSPVSIRITKSGDQVLIEVSDHGQGISAASLPHIFSRFYRDPDLPPGMHGSGLGLYICDQIIRSHHGSIQASSKPGEGATFLITLPVRQNQPASTTASEKGSHEH